MPVYCYRLPDGEIVTRLLPMAARKPASIRVSRGGKRVRATRDIPAEQRTFVVPVDEKLTIMVVELLQQYPLDRQRFSQLVSPGLLQRLLLGEELEAIDGAVEEAFGFETMVKRHNFKVKRRATEEDETDGEADETEGDIASAGSGATG